MLFKQWSNMKKKVFSSGGSALQISIERGLLLEGAPIFFKKELSQKW